MCGRYAASRNPDDLVEEFEVTRVDHADQVVPDWNVAPTKTVPAVLTRRRRDAPRELPERRLTVLSWGLVPSWAKDAAIGSRLINARMETLAEKPAFRRAFAARRCLLPADGYYEWYAGTDPVTGKARKQPFFIRPRGDRPLAMAGLYEIWRDPAAAADEGSFRWTCTVITTRAQDAVGHLHDRMPLIVEPARYATWLDPTQQDAATLLGLLVPAAPGRLDAYPVSHEVNNVRNNGPHLVEPLPPEAPAGTPPTQPPGAAEGPPAHPAGQGGLC